MIAPRQFRFAFVPTDSARLPRKLASLEGGGAALAIVSTPAAFLDIDPLPGHTVVAIPLDGDLVANGVRLTGSRVAQVSRGDRLHLRVDAPRRLAIVAAVLGADVTDMRPHPVGPTANDWENARESLVSLVAGRAPARTRRSVDDWLGEVAKLAAVAQPVVSAKASQDASILKKVDEYLHANIGVPVYNQAVAARAGVSTRTLHNLMVNLRGVGLARYVHILRLWRTYNALSQDTLVKTVAMDNGFTHLGRFALDFRSQFGVLPRDVRLARSYSAPVAGDPRGGETAVGASATGGHRAEPDVGARIGC